MNQWSVTKGVSRKLVCSGPMVGIREQDGHVLSITIHHPYRIELWVWFRVRTMMSMGWVDVALHYMMMGCLCNHEYSCMIFVSWLWFGWDVNTWYYGAYWYVYVSIVCESTLIILSTNYYLNVFSSLCMFLRLCYSRVQIIRYLTRSSRLRAL